MDKPKPNILGVLFEQIRLRRKALHDAAVRDIYKRNDVTAHTPGHKLEFTKRINRDGVEVVEYRLYKVLDCTVTSMRIGMESKTDTGLGTINEKLR